MLLGVLLDSNVLLSGFVGWRYAASVPARIVRAWRDGEFRLATSAFIIAEVARALSRPYFASLLPVERREELLQMLRDEAWLVEPSAVVPTAAPDPTDNHVLAAAIAANADYLVTGDRTFRSVGEYGGVRLLTPREFLNVLTPAP